MTAPVFDRVKAEQQEALQRDAALVALQADSVQFTQQRWAYQREYQRYAESVATVQGWVRHARIIVATAWWADYDQRLAEYHRKLAEWQAAYDQWIIDDALCQAQAQPVTPTPVPPSPTGSPSSPTPTPPPPPDCPSAPEAPTPPDEPTLPRP